MPAPKFIEKLQAQAEENPMLALGVGATLLAAAAKFVDAASSVRSRKAYAKRMNRPAKR